MFTGIVTAVGRIERATPSEAGLRLTIDAGALDMRDVAIGDSIAVNGVCLTVIAAAGARSRKSMAAARPSAMRSTAKPPPPMLPARG